MGRGGDPDEGTLERVNFLRNQADELNKQAEDIKRLITDINNFHITAETHESANEHRIAADYFEYEAKAIGKLGDPSYKGRETEAWSNFAKNSAIAADNSLEHADNQALKTYERWETLEAAIYRYEGALRGLTHMDIDRESTQELNQKCLVGLARATIYQFNVIRRSDLYGDEKAYKLEELVPTASVALERASAAHLDKEVTNLIKIMDDYFIDKQRHLDREKISFQTSVDRVSLKKTTSTS
ncbi:MAG: hypothetical protein KGH60_03745 [Candidatus Micrarchaeota archaeon]|nr:hypothetical protein [Candidatus Micrarchaeota archaeon]